MTPEEYQCWALQYHQALSLIKDAEQAVIESLKAIGWPTTPEAIYATAAGKLPTPARATLRDRRRALSAMHALAHLRDAKTAIGPTAPNAPRAAFAALLAGLHASDLNRARVLQSQTTRAAMAKGSRARADSRAVGWSAEVAKRHPGMTKAAAIARIARRERLKPDSVKKGIGRQKTRK